MEAQAVAKGHVLSAVDFTLDYIGYGDDDLDEESLGSLLLLWGLSTEETWELLQGQQLTTRSQAVELLTRKRLLVDPISVMARCRVLRDTFLLLAKDGKAPVEDVLAALKATRRCSAPVLADLARSWSSPQVSFYELLQAICKKRLKELFGFQSLCAFLAAVSDAQSKARSRFSDYRRLLCCQQGSAEEGAKTHSSWDPFLSQCCTAERWPEGEMQQRAPSHPGGRCYPVEQVLPREAEAEPCLKHPSLPSKLGKPHFMCHHQFPSRSSQVVALPCDLEAQLKEAGVQGVEADSPQHSMKEKSLSGEYGPVPSSKSRDLHSGEGWPVAIERAASALSAKAMDPTFRSFANSWCMVCPSRRTELTFDQVQALLALQGLEPERAFLIAAQLSRVDPLGTVAVSQVLEVVQRLGLDGAQGKGELCRLAWDGLNPMGKPLAARDLAKMVARVTHEADFAAELYGCCEELGLSFVSLADFAQLLMQPQFATFIRTGGLQLLAASADDGNREEDLVSPKLTLLERSVMRFMPVVSRDPADAHEPPTPKSVMSRATHHSTHWRKAELFSDEYCMREVETLQVLSVKTIVVLTTILSGLNSTLFALANVLVCGVAEDQVQSSSSLLFHLVSNGYGLLLTLGEIAVMALLATGGAVVLARVAGVAFSADHEQRTVVLSAFLRAALDQGFEAGSLLGVDPLKKAHGLQVLLLGLCITLQRSVLRIVLKLLLKRIVPRMIAKTGQAVDESIAVIVSLLFGLHASWTAMQMASFCCLGPTAAVNALCRLFDERDAAVARAGGAAQVFPDGVKLAVIRAVGVIATEKRHLYVHPNMVYVLNFLQNIWVTDHFIERVQEQLEEERSFLATGSLSGTTSRLSRGSSGWEETVKEGCLSLDRLRWYVKRQDRSQALEKHKTQHKKLLQLHLDEEALFLRNLEDLSPEDFTLVMAVLVLAVILDGDITRADWHILSDALRQSCAEPPAPSLAALGQARRHLFDWYSVSPRTLYAVFDGRGAGCLIPGQPEFRVFLSAGCAALVSRLLQWCGRS